MKRILRHYAVNLLALYLISQTAKGLVFEKGAETYLIAAGALTIATMLGKPIINLLLLPLNLVTFGLFRWVSSAIALFIVTLVVKTFKIIGFEFQGLTTKWFDIPPMNFKGIMAYVAFSFFLSITISFIHWIRK